MCHFSNFDSILTSPQDMKAQLLSVVHTNVAPSMAQKRQIEGVVAAFEADIAELDTQIARAQVKKKIGLAQVHAYRAALSSARRLPHEIVSEIFTVVAHDLPTIQQVLRLSHICGAWRHVAIETPKLWANVRVCVSSANRNKSMSIVRMFCDRASKAPLRITIILLDLNIDLQNPIDALAPYTMQIKSLSLIIPQSHFQGLASLPAQSFPVLEYLYFKSSELELAQFDSFQGSLPPIVESVTDNPFASAHRLKTITFHGSLGGRSFQPPAQLTVLDIGHGVSCAEVVAALVHCPNIVALVCEFGTIGGRFPDEPVVLLNLHILEVTTDSVTPFCHLFDHITVPALTVLELDIDNPGRDSWSQTSFESLIARSACLLTELYVMTVEISGPEFITIMELLPYLVLIQLDDVSFVEDDILLPLVYRQNGGFNNILPRLTSLSMSCHRCYPTPNLVLEVVKSRWWPETDEPSDASTNRPARLEKFSIKADDCEEDMDGLEEEIELEIKRIQEAGLDLSMVYCFDPPSESD